MRPSTRQFPFPAHLHALTGVRFFLALGVVLFHYHLFWVFPPEAVPLIGRGRLSVDIFFILSGFILTHVYLTGTRMPPYWQFICARFARIYPAHFYILCGILILTAGAGLVGVGIDHHNFSKIDFFKTLLLVHAWFPTEHMANWNGPSWSLSAEWLTYLCFPAFAYIGLRWRDRPLWLIALAIMSFSALDLLYQTIYGKILTEAQENLGILLVMPEFVYGMGLYFFGQTIYLARRQAISLAIFMTVLILGAMQAQLDDRVVVAIAGPFILSIGLLAKSGEDSFLSHKWLQFSGEASFALYLVHMPILMVWRNVMQKWFDLEKTYRMGLVEVILLLVITLCAAALIHVLFEQPSRRWLRGKLDRKSITNRSSMTETISHRKN